MTRQHKSPANVETSRIVCIVSLNPIENLNPDEKLAFYRWYHHRTGKNPDDFHRKPARHQEGMILRWLSSLAFIGARVGFRILAVPSDITIE